MKPVENVRASGITDKFATISWRSYPYTYDHYIVELVSGSGKITRKVNSGATSFDFSSLKQNTKYDVTVYAVRNGVNSPASSDYAFSTLSGKKIFINKLTASFAGIE